MNLEDEVKTHFEFDIPGAPEELFINTGLVEFQLKESLLTPATMIDMGFNAYRHEGYVKNWDLTAGEDVVISINRPINAKYGINTTLDINNHKVYKLANRFPSTVQIDAFSLHACHTTLLQNASTRVSKSWKCTNPSAIVNDVLTNCLGVTNYQIEGSDPPRTYFAENIHPYQVIAQQADVALAPGNDPSFLHFMTLEDFGKHHFESLYSMARKEPVAYFRYEEPGTIKEGQITAYEDPTKILKYHFPSDFDILSDILNGVNEDGQDIYSLIVLNPFNGLKSVLNADKSGCGMNKTGENSFTNKDSAQGEGNCEIDVEKYRLKRQARLGLLDRERIALSFTVPFNPDINVGKTVYCEFFNKIHQGDTMTTQPDYGSGKYLVVSLFHEIKLGGYATTSVECVSESVGYSGSTIGF